MQAPQARRAVPRVELGKLIERIFAPLLGETLARASVRAQLQRLAIDSPTLTAAEVDALLRGLEKGLRVFVGSVKAAELVQSVRDAVEEGELG
jgi:hypothetical protein